MTDKALLLSALMLMACVLPVSAQQPAVNGSVVPSMVKFTGAVTDLSHKPLTGTVGVTFSLYKDAEGGAPLWMETQNVQADRAGHYSVMLGSTRSQGLPADLFISGEARWLAVRAEGQAEQPRILLLSVPYALKAADAQTLGGLPPSAYMLASLPSDHANPGGTTSSPSESTAPLTNAAVTGAGAANFLPLWDTSSDIVNSVVFQSGSGTTARIGINTTTPTSTLDVKGGATVRGSLVLPTTGTATSTVGKNSQPLNLTASSFNSGIATPVNQTFRWQAEPAGNNTANPAGTLNLLFGQGNTTPTETGLKLSNKGLFTFVAGQKFPGTGTGTITGVTAGSGLIGGGTSGNVTLSLTDACDTGLSLKWNGSAWTCFTPATVSSVVLSAPATDFTVSGSPVTGSGTLGFSWILAPASSNTVNAIVKRDGLGNIAVTSVFASNFSGPGVQAVGNTVGGFGVIGSGFTGVKGIASTGGTGVFGQGPNDGIGVYGSGRYGVQGLGLGGGAGVYGTGNVGVWGASGTGGTGVYAVNTGTGDALIAENQSGGYAGYFSGDVFVNGTLSKSGGSFKIDHPLDPANKYLYHSFVESPDMMNIYNGDAVLDERGQAVIKLPEWFGSLNGEFRYQLTAIGAPGPNLYVAEKVHDNSFKIAGGQPGMEVSWQVTGVRHDAWANAHRIPVEQLKPEKERGFYLYPELFGAPKEKSIGRAHHPEMQKLAEEQRPQPPSATNH